MYADYIQVYITCDGDQVPTGTIEECVGEICNWMRTNMLALNDRNSHVSTKFNSQGQVPPRELHVGGISISSSNAMSNLVVMMDSAGSMSNHVLKLCKSASRVLLQINRIINLLNQSTTLTLIHAFVKSKMDYSNSLLFGLPSRKIKKCRFVKILQHVSSQRQENIIT